MRFLSISLIVLVGTSHNASAQCRFSTKTTARAVTYRFQPKVTPDGLVLHVTLEFKAADGGTDELVVPTRWAGEALHAVTNLRAVSKGASLEYGTDAGTKIVHAVANRSVVIGYDLKKDWSGPLIHPMQFHPVLLPDYLEFTGKNALVRLMLPKEAHETANFDWQRLPAAWALATSFGTSTSAARRCQTFKGPWIEVDDGLYAAGDFRIHKFQIGRRAAVLAVRGKWTFTDDEAIAKIQKTIGMVRSFWHDDNFPYFLVTLKPYDQDHGDSDGSAFTNAFWMYASRLDSMDGLLSQLAHETFHAWNPFRMGATGTATDYEETKWFKEGGTEYYAQLLTYRAGELPVGKYVGSINKDLRQFPVSKDEYIRGRMIALWLDATIRRQSGGKHSLDNVMFDMVRGAAQPYTLTRILATVDRYLSPESRTLLRNAAKESGNLPAPEHIPNVSECFRPTLQDLATYDLGLDGAHSRASGVISGVVDGGPAFAAGLRNGQRLIRISVYNGETNRLAKFTVRTDAGDKEIAFYPRGKTVASWQYRLDSSGACERLP